MPELKLINENIRQELEETRRQFHELLAAIPIESYSQPSANPAWNIGQLLYHMSLAPRMLPADARLIRQPRAIYRLIPRLVPPGLFNWLNELITRWGARCASPEILGREYDRGHAAALRVLSSIREQEWGKGAEYPDWDRELSGYVTLEKLFHYLAAHFRAHSEEIRKALEIGEIRD